MWINGLATLTPAILGVCMSMSACPELLAQQFFIHRAWGPTELKSSSTEHQRFNICSLILRNVSFQPKSEHVFQTLACISIVNLFIVDCLKHRQIGSSPPRSNLIINMDILHLFTYIKQRLLAQTKSSLMSPFIQKPKCELPDLVNLDLSPDPKFMFYILDTPNPRLSLLPLFVGVLKNYSRKVQTIL